MKKPSLMVRADASTAIGSGHVMRCLALAQAWQRTGGVVRYLMAENIPALDPRLAAANIGKTTFAVTPGSREDAALTAEWARQLEASWVVVDGYRFGPEYIGRLKSAGLNVLLLDDDARFDFYGSDIILNQNMDARPEMYPRCAPGIRLLLGADFVLLRPEFSQEPRDRRIADGARKILVTMGGSDPENVTEKILHALSWIAEADFEAAIVVGGGNPHQELLEAATKELAEKVRLEKNPSNIAPLMAWSDVAISAAGGTCWELAFLGVPMIVIVLTSDQNANASAISEQGAGQSLGWHANLSPQQIADALKNLMQSANRRREMSQRGRTLVDGEGPARVVKFMQNSL